MYALRYCCISFLPRESRERIVPMGHESIAATSPYEKSPISTKTIGARNSSGILLNPWTI